MMAVSRLPVFLLGMVFAMKEKEPARGLMAGAALALAAGLALLAAGAQALLYSATTLANLTGTIQALWAASLISLGFCIPLLVEALEHPLGSVWKWFAVRCRYYPPDSLPIQLLNSAILNLTLALPISSLMYRHKLPVGAQFRSYEVPVCAAMALMLLLPPLCSHKLTDEVSSGEKPCEI